MNPAWHLVRDKLRPRVTFEVGNVFDPEEWIRYVAPRLKLDAEELLANPEEFLAE